MSYSILNASIWPPASAGSTAIRAGYPTSGGSSPSISRQETDMLTAIDLAARHAMLYRDVVVSRIVRRLGAAVPGWLAAEPFGPAEACDAELDAFESEASVPRSEEHTSELQSR